MNVSKGAHSLKIDSSESRGSDETTEVTNTLLADLRLKNVTKLFVVGLAYDNCVGATACDGAAHGFQTYIVTDATKSVAKATVEAMDRRV